MDIVIDNTSTTNTSKPKRRRTRENWQALFKEWENSSQTQQAFCQERGLCYRQFNQWKSRFKQEGLIEQKDNTAAQFVSIHLKAPASVVSTSGVQVYLPNGIRIEVPSANNMCRYCSIRPKR